MIRLVSLDGDDTLWDFDASMRRRLEQVLEVVWSERFGESTIQLTVDGLIATRERVAAELEGRVLDLKAVRLAAFERSLEEAGAPDPDLAARMSAVYFQDPVYELFDDVLPSLRRLQTKRQLALVTNGDTDPGEVGLGAFFAHAANAPRVGSAKPDPAIFHMVLEALGAAAGDAVHVGDSPHHDIAGAHRAGMRAVLLDRHHTTHPERLAGDERPDAMINSLEELPELLAAWDAG